MNRHKEYLCEVQRERVFSADTLREHLCEIADVIKDFSPKIEGLVSVSISAEIRPAETITKVYFEVECLADPRVKDKG